MTANRNIADSCDIASVLARLSRNVPGQAAMNVLSREKQIEIISALTEGLGIRAAARITGVNRDTVGKLAYDVGRGCAELHDRAWTIGNLLDAALSAAPPVPTQTAPDRRRQFRVIQGGKE